MSILFYGDAHGEWKPLIRACETSKPGAVVLVGDLDLDRPLREVLAPIWKAGIPVHYIPGNHDIDKPDWWSNLVDDHPSGNLHGRVVEICGQRIAGLGGVFEEPVWEIQNDGSPVARFQTRSEFLADLRAKGRYDGDELPLIYRATIFSEDIDALIAQGPADIMVCHDGPPILERHPYGVEELAVLAEVIGVKLVVHGHLHRSFEGELSRGQKVRGLGRAEVLPLIGGLT